MLKTFDIGTGLTILKSEGRKRWSAHDPLSHHPEGTRTMPFQKDTTPSTVTEPARQACGDDPFDIGNIPDFLRRSPNPAEPTAAAEVLRSTPHKPHRQEINR